MTVLKIRSLDTCSEVFLPLLLSSLPHSAHVSCSDRLFSAGTVDSRLFLITERSASTVQSFQHLPASKCLRWRWAPQIWGQSWRSSGTTGEERVVVSCVLGTSRRSCLNSHCLWEDVSICRWEKWVCRSVCSPRVMEPVMSQILSASALWREHGSSSSSSCALSSQLPFHSSLLSYSHWKKNVLCRTGLFS